MSTYNQGYLDAVIAIRTLLETKKFLLKHSPDSELATEVRTLKEAINFLKIKVEDNEESERSTWG